MIEQTTTLLTVGFTAWAVVFVALVSSEAVTKFIESLTDR